MPRRKHDKKISLPTHAPTPKNTIVDHRRLVRYIQLGQIKSGSDLKNFIKKHPEAKASINKKVNGVNAIVMAIKSRARNPHRSSLVRALLDNGASIYSTDPAGLTLIELARIGGLNQTFRLLNQATQTKITYPSIFSQRSNRYRVKVKAMTAEQIQERAQPLPNIPRPKRKQEI